MTRILIACEYSGVFRRAFAALGAEAWSCDLLPSEDASARHIVDDCFSVISKMRPDAVIAHPPCTHLAVSGARHFAAKRADGRQQEGIAFFLRFTQLTMPFAIENPIGIMSRLYRKPDQIVQPWMFGHGETKATCWWTQGLPLIPASNIVEGRVARCHRLPPSENRWKERSRSYPGMAAAAAAAAAWLPAIARGG